MDISVGVLVGLALLAAISLQLAMLSYQLRRIYEKLQSPNVWTDFGSLAQAQGFPSPGPHHLPGSPFSTSMDLHNTK